MEPYLSTDILNTYPKVDEPAVDRLLAEEITANKDKIIVLDDGKIVGKGRHEELLENCDVYQEIYHSQFAKEDEEDEDNGKDWKLAA